MLFTLDERDEVKNLNCLISIFQHPSQKSYKSQNPWLISFKFGGNTYDKPEIPPRFGNVCLSLRKHP
jgi:hypothetical protein